VSAFRYLAQNWPEVGAKLSQHLSMVGAAVLISLVSGLALGILFTRPGLKRAGQALVGITGAAQAIPSIAVIALIFAYTGIGARTAVIALSIYGIVPILFNVVSALLLVPVEMLEAAMGVGTGPRCRSSSTSSFPLPRSPS